jgi:hypothetical protein
MESMLIKTFKTQTYHKKGTNITGRTIPKVPVTEEGDLKRGPLFLFIHHNLDSLRPLRLLQYHRAELTLSAYSIKF